MVYRMMLAVCLAAVSVFSAAVVDLTIKETAGIDRVNEDVTMGVPLPENGAYTDAALFTLRDEANAIIPCEIKKISVWHKNPSRIRWLQLNFPYSITANATKTVTLTSETNPYALSSKLTAVDNGATITVNTGKIRFIVKKANFNLLDQAWVDESGGESYTDANKVVAAHSRGVIHYLGGIEYLSSNDAASTAVIERQGAGVVTIKAAGQLKNASGIGTLHFVTRMYAFNNSSRVKVQNSIEFRNNLVSQTVNIQGIHMEIPLNLGASRTVVVGTPGGYAQASIASGQDAFCMAQRPAGSLTSMGSVINGSAGGVVPASTFNPKLTKPKDLGWVSLSDGSRGCLVSMRYFWQMVPASVEAFGDGKIIAGLFSKRSGQTPVPLYAGTGRTYETEWVFYNSRTPAALRSTAAACTDRLFALASPFWYTRRTLSAIVMPEIKQDIYTPANWAIVSAWDQKLGGIWETILSSDDLILGHDSYGFLEWGDNPLNAYGLPEPCDIMWNGNYYGLDLFAFEQFYHTGDIRFLRYGIAHARHVQDVHQIHFGPADPNTGSSRYCPPTNHIATDDGACTPDLGNMSHHKIEGLFMDYYLTGNDYALQCALEGADWSERQGWSFAVGPSEHIAVYIRRWAHQMYDLVWAYQYNQAKKYYDRLWQNWELFRRNIVTPNDTIGQPFMVGLGMEAVVKMYDILAPTYTTNTATKNDSMAHYLKIWCDTVNTWPTTGGSMAINANTTLAYAFLSQFYGPSYLTMSASKGALMPSSPSPLHKMFPQQGRNMEMAMYYFAIPDSVKAYQTGAEKGIPALARAPDLDLDVVPNPFTAVTRIRISGSLSAGDARPVLRIYTLDGTLVKDLSGWAASGSHEVLWKPDRGASNVYLVKCRAGGRSLVKKITLLK